MDWERSPKTDYTYARSASYRENGLKNGYISPNMSRRGLHSRLRSTSLHSSSNEKNNIDNSTCEFLAHTPVLIPQRNSDFLSKHDNSITRQGTIYNNLSNSQQKFKKHIKRKSLLNNINSLESSDSISQIAEKFFDRNIEKSLEYAGEPGIYKEKYLPHLYGLDSEEDFVAAQKKLNVCESLDTNTANKFKNVSHLHIETQQNYLKEFSIKTINSFVLFVKKFFKSLLTIFCFLTNYIRYAWNAVIQHVFHKKSSSFSSDSNLFNSSSTTTTTTTVVTETIETTDEHKFISVLQYLFTNLSFLLGSLQKKFFTKNTIKQSKNRRNCCLCLLLFCLVPLLWGFLHVISRRVLSSLSLPSEKTQVTSNYHLSFLDSKFNQFEDKINLLMKNDENRLKEFVELKSSTEKEYLDFKSDTDKSMQSIITKLVNAEHKVDKQQKLIDDLFNQISIQKDQLSTSVNNNKLLMSQLKTCCKSDEYIMGIINRVIGSYNFTSQSETQNLFSILDSQLTEIQKNFINFESIFSSYVNKSASLCKSEPLNHSNLENKVTNDLTIKVNRLIKDALSVYAADKTGRVDYALESAGGSVVSIRCSETYYQRTAQLSIFGIPLWYVSNSPRTVIQPEVNAGQCWAFKGSQGFIVIQLAGTILPDSFSLEHIPKSLSPTGKIDSAPKDFSVLGLTHEQDTVGNVLGNYTYDQNGSPLQQFSVSEPVTDAYRFIELRILSNHGNPKYTCLYRFRVHGVLKKW